MKRKILLLLLALILLSNTVTARYEEGEMITISGTVSEIEWFHDGRNELFKALILTLDEPADFYLYSLDAEFEKELMENITEVQIWSYDDDLSNLVDKHITVTGEIFMGHTQYHRRAVMFIVSNYDAGYSPETGGGYRNAVYIFILLFIPAILFLKKYFNLKGT